MVSEKLARRYATGTFTLARERGVVERVGSDLHTLRDAITSRPDSEAFFLSPTIDRREKERILAATFDGRVDDVALHTLLLLVRKRREAILRALVTQYDALALHARGVEPLLVTTARELAPFELSDLVARLEQTYGKRFEAQQYTDPSLIGGICITMGDRVIDGSIAGRFDDLARNLFAPA
ncbi:MAG: ATP synthase F1 subunit delta [Vulcanimicrobiaceae bacterium]